MHKSIIDNAVVTVLFYGTRLKRNPKVGVCKIYDNMTKNPRVSQTHNSYFGILVAWASTAMLG